MIKQKYVVFDNLMAVVLYPGISHADVAVKDVNPTSAGFFKLVSENGKIDVCVYGESDSLGLASTPFDALLLKQTLFGNMKGEL